MKAKVFLESVKLGKEVGDFSPFAMRVIRVLTEMVNDSAELNEPQQGRVYDMLISFAVKNIRMAHDDEDFVTLELVSVANYINSCKL